MPCNVSMAVLLRQVLSFADSRSQGRTGTRTNLGVRTSFSWGLAGPRLGVSQGVLASVAWFFPHNIRPPGRYIGSFLYKKIRKKMIFGICKVFRHFWTLYGVPEVREVSKKLPGARALRLD